MAKGSGRVCAEQTSHGMKGRAVGLEAVSGRIIIATSFSLLALGITSHVLTYIREFQQPRALYKYCPLRRSRHQLEHIRARRILS